MAEPSFSSTESRKKAVRFITEQIRHVCTQLPARTPGSEGEYAAAEYMAGILRNDCGCRVETECFDFHPGGFWGYLRFCVVLDFLCAWTFFITPWLSLFFGTVSMALMISEYILYREPIDPLFTKKQGTNVTAVRPAGDTVRQRVLFTGHMDAAWEATLSYHISGTFYIVHALIATAGVLLYCLWSALALIGVGAWINTAAKISLLFLLVWPGVLFYCNGHRTVDGANDNLTGCFLSIALMKTLQDHHIQLKHTEVGVVLTGAEEAGLRGAKAWVKAHKEEYWDIPTYLFTIDTIHHPQFLMVNQRDMNGLVRNDRELADLFVNAAKEMNIPCGKGSIPMMGGSTDSAAFRQGGFRSVSIAGMDHHLEDYYHTRRDTCDRLDPEGIGNCFTVMARMLGNIDKHEE